MSEKTSSLKLIPVMLAFFAMGFVDLVGIASNYLKADLGLSDSEANIFPSLVFFWFLIFSVPTGMLMNRIGRKKTVLLSLIVTFLSLMIPIFDDAYMVMLISFSLLGIGNALMQTSLNPLLSNIVSGDKLASSLTFGQFVKAIASFLAPYIAMWGATQAIPSMELGWRVLFPVYMVIAVIAILLLGATTIHETKEEGRPSTFGECLALLGKPFILLCFIRRQRQMCIRDSLWRMSGFAGQAFYPALLYRYHVPCGDRCRDEYDRPEDLDGTSGHDVGRRRLRHEPLFHIPYGGMLLRGFYLAKSLSERILRL